MSKSDDTISRQDVVEAIEFGITYAKAINKETGEVKELFQVSNDELRKAADRIKQLPYADRPTGEWKQISPARIYECSECGQNVMTNDIEAYKFCHNCGANMSKIKVYDNEYGQ